MRRLRSLSVVALLTALSACKDEGPKSADGGPVETPPAEPAAASDGGAAKADGDGGEQPKADTPRTNKGGGLAGLAVGLVSDAKDAAKTPLTVMPADARWVMHVDLAALSKAPPVAPIREYMVKQISDEPDAADMLRRLADCKLDLDALQSFTMAQVGEGSGTMVGVVKGTGFGRPEAYECVADRLRRDGKDVDFEVREENGEKVLIDDEDRGYFLDEDAIMLVDDDLTGTIAELRAGKGKSVTDGKLATVLAKVDQDKHAWIAFLAGPGTALDSGPMAEATAAWGTMHYDQSLAVEFVSESADGTSAESIRAELQKNVDEMSSVFPMLGMPSSVHAGISVDRKDAVVTLSVSLSESELEGVSTAVRNLMR